MMSIVSLGRRGGGEEEARRRSTCLHREQMEVKPPPPPPASGLEMIDGMKRYSADVSVSMRSSRLLLLLLLLFASGSDVFDSRDEGAARRRWDENKKLLKCLTGEKKIQKNELTRWEENSRRVL